MHSGTYQVRVLVDEGAMLYREALVCFNRSRLPMVGAAIGATLPVREFPMRITVWLMVLPAATVVGCSSCPRVTSFQPNVPQGGRAVAIAVHPSTSLQMFVASES